MMDETEAAPKQQAIDPVQFLSAVMAVANVADMLDETKLATIASDVIRDHEIDRESMKDWMTRMQRGVDLASMVKETKSYPFEKAANVKYPLITTAALQFNARAYQAVVPPGDIVKVKVHGKDPQGRKAARAARVSAHMSYQLGSQIEEWDEATDEMLTVLPIVGTVVRKVWYDPGQARPRVRNIKPGGFVINASARTLTEAPRIGEVLPLYPSEIMERRRSGMFRDIDYVEVDGNDSQAVQDFVEQHCRLDLDGDGYGEPYIVTVHMKSQKVARIVADFDAADVMIGESGVMAIRRGTYFVAYHFLPAVDGGFFGMGLGFLLGDISESINTVINMMMDAGHMASRGGGFIGSDFRIKGGAQQFRPGEWKLAATTGADIRNSIVPMTFPGPDATLFQLLGLLIEAGREVASVKDVLTGDSGGRVQTATTTLALIEQGMQQFTAAYQRIFRAMRKEFRLIAKMNGTYLSPEEYSAFCDEVDENGQPVKIDPAQEYAAAGMDIEPVADPRSVSRMQEAAKAEIVMQLAAQGLVDKGEATKRVLQAASIGDVDGLAPKPDPMQEMMAQAMPQIMQADLTLKMVSVEQALADLAKTRAETIKVMGEAEAKETMVRLDAARLQLEAIREGLGQLIGRGPGGMAGAPGYGGGQGLPAPSSGFPAPVGNGGLLGGQGMAGSGAPFGFAS